MPKQTLFNARLSQTTTLGPEVTDDLICHSTCLLLVDHHRVWNSLGKMSLYYFEVFAQKDSMDEGLGWLFRLGW